MTSFDHLWQLLDSHGVIENKRADCARYWDTFSLEEQRAIYCSIRSNIQAGRFVNYNPVKAVRDNVPKKQPRQVLTFDQYYTRFHTTTEQPGWRMVTPKTGNVYYEHL